MEIHVKNGDADMTCYVNKIAMYPNGLIRVYCDANNIGYLLLALNNTPYTIDVDGYELILGTHSCSFETDGNIATINVEDVATESELQELAAVRETVARQREAEAEEQRVKASKLNSVRPEPVFTKTAQAKSSGAVVD